MGLKATTAVASKVANLLSEVPRNFAWSHVQWIVRILEDAARRDTDLYRAIGAALHSALVSGVRMGSLGEPFPEDVVQRDEARKIADGLPLGLKSSTLRTILTQAGIPRDDFINALRR